MSDTPEPQPNPADKAPEDKVSDKASSNSATTAKAESAPSIAGRPAANVQPAKPARRSRGGSILLTLVLLLLIAGVGGLAWFHLEQRMALDALKADIAELAQQNSVTPDQLASVQQDQQQALARLQETESALQQLQAAVQQMETAVQQSIQQGQQSAQQEQQAIEQTLAETSTRIAAQAERLDGISRELVTTNLRIRDSGAGASQAWMLSEAESLLRLAQQRLLVARDVRSAISLFIAADDLLKQLNDPSVFAVREMLAQELATLQGLPEVDVQGLYVQLGAQIERIDSFAVADESNSQNFTVPAAADDGVAEAASDWLSSAKEALGRYFVVSQRNEAVTPLMTAEQEYLIRRSIQLQIEQARLALLRGQTEIYQRALDETINAVATRLQDGAGSRNNLIAALTTLRDTPIAVSIPPLNNTLAAIRQVLPAAADTPAEGGL